MIKTPFGRFATEPQICWILNLKDGRKNVKSNIITIIDEKSLVVYPLFNGRITKDFFSKDEIILNEPACIDIKGS